MSNFRAEVRRNLPGSPFNVPEVPASPPVVYTPEDLVTHDKYGVGTVISVEQGIAVTVNFRSHTQRLNIPCTKLTKL